MYFLDCASLIQATLATALFLGSHIAYQGIWFNVISSNCWDSLALVPAYRASWIALRLSRLRLLIHVAFGALKSGKPFNPALHGG
jgi:hypothetical protein